MSTESQFIQAAFKTGAQSPNPFTVTEQIPFPTINDDELLVKTMVAGANPSDWKHCLFFPGKFLAGSDGAGIVHSVGKNVKGFEVGDIVSAVVHGNVENRRGMFAEYFIANPVGTIKYNPDTFDKNAILSVGVHPPSKINNFEAAAASTLCLSTVALVFGHYMKINRNDKDNTSKFLLVWGGATSVGVYAIQLAKLIYGVKVVTCASPNNHEFLKQLGADAVFDYHDPEIIEKIRQHCNGKITWALDAVSTKETFQSTYDTTIGSETVHINNLSSIPKEDIVINPSDKRSIEFSITVLYAIFGEAFPWIGGKIFEVDPPLVKDFEEFWYNVLPQYINQLTTPNLRVLKKGVESANEALEILFSEANSCEKLVWRI